MESGTKNKIGFLAIGLVAGISLGVLFGYAIKAGLSRLNFLHSGLHQIDAREGQISNRLDSIVRMDITGKSKIAIKEPVPKHGNTVYIIKTQPLVNEKQLETDNKINKPDGRNTAHLTSADTNVVVMTDQMVAAQTIPLTILDTMVRSPAARISDSLINALNGEESQGDTTSYRVELWESPINLKGYKMSEGKLILFGINSTLHVKIVQYNNAFYLLIGQYVFNAELTDDFRPLDKVSDKNLIKKLQKKL